MTLGEAVVLEQVAVPAQERVDVDDRLRGEVEPHESGPLGARERREAEAGPVEVAEVLRVEHADEATLVVVAPTVVGAGVAAGRPDPLGGDDRAAVAAHVEERPQLAVGATGDEVRRAEHLAGEIGVRLGELARGSDDERESAEHAVHLDPPPVLVDVVRDRDLLDPRGLPLRPLRTVRERPPRHLHQLLSGHRPRLPWLAAASTHRM